MKAYSGLLFILIWMQTGNLVRAQLVQAKQCPAIHVNESVMQVTGEPLRARSGDSLRFWCKDRHLEVDGPERIYCNERGQWSAPTPTCKARTCGHPGDVQFAEFTHTNGEDYALGSAVQYTCQTSYQMLYGSGLRRCTLNGWDGGMPRCEAVTCTLTPPSQGTTYEPDARSFSPGDAITVTCKSGYFIGVHSDTSRRIHCKDDGDWELSPMCEEIRCGAPHDPGLDWKDYDGQNRLHNTFQYTCKPGYKHDSRIASATANCSATGWTPQPLCEVEPTRCGQPPHLVGGDFTGVAKSHYDHNERVDYDCQRYWTLDGDPYRTCQNGQWIGQMRCLKPNRCGKPPHLDNGEFTGAVNSQYNHSERVEYVCLRNYKMYGEPYRTCQDGQWIGQMGCRTCSSELGIHYQRRQVLDNQLTASSVYSASYPAYNARLGLGNSNSWYPATDDHHQWLQVDLRRRRTITGIITQGASYTYSYFVRSFKVSHSDDGWYWTFIKDANGSDKIFTGNHDDSSMKTNLFEPPITRRFVRVHPWTWYNGITLRIELLGCD